MSCGSCVNTTTWRGNNASSWNNTQVCKPLWETALTAGVLCSASKKRRHWNRNKDSRETRWREANQTSSQTRLGVWAAPQGVKNRDEQFDTSSPPPPNSAFSYCTYPRNGAIQMWGEEKGVVELMGYIFTFGLGWELCFSAPHPSARLIPSLAPSLCYGSYGWGRLPFSNGLLSWHWWYNLVDVWESKSCWCSGMGGRFEWKIVLMCMMEQTVFRSNIIHKLLAFRQNIAGNFCHEPFNVSGHILNMVFF